MFSPVKCSVQFHPAVPRSVVLGSHRILWKGSRGSSLPFRASIACRVRLGHFCWDRGEHRRLWLVRREGVQGIRIFPFNRWGASQEKEGLRRSTPWASIGVIQGSKEFQGQR